MSSYVIGLEQMGYTLLNEIRIFSEKIGQPTTEEVTFNIYKELMAQIISTYSSREAEVAMAVSSLPIWPTILYVEDQHAFFDIKREFAARVRLFALALTALLRRNIPEDPGLRYTYLMEAATVTMVIVNVYLDSNYA